jgi:hypothetical protein
MCEEGEASKKQKMLSHIMLLMLVGYKRQRAQQQQRLLAYRHVNYMCGG